MSLTTDELLKEISKNARINNDLTTKLREDMKLLAASITKSLVETDGIHVFSDTFYVDSFYRLALSGADVVLQRKRTDQLKLCAIRPDGSYVEFDNFEYFCTFENVPFTLIPITLDILPAFLNNVNVELVRQINKQHDITEKIRHTSNEILQDALSVQCPRCQSPSGKECMAIAYDCHLPLGGVHDQRKIAAKSLKEENK